MTVMFTSVYVLLLDDWWHGTLVSIWAIFMPWWVGPQRHTVVIIVCVCVFIRFSAQLLKSRH